MFFQDEGSLFAAAGHRHAAGLVALGLRALQHRASAGAGIAAADGHVVRHHLGRGRAADVFSASDLEFLSGGVAVGRLTGSAGPEQLDASRITEPVVRTFWDGQFAVAMSGRLSNGSSLREQLLAKGALFQGGSDGEVVAHLLAGHTRSTFVNRLVSVLFDLEGAWSLLVSSEDRLVAARDPRGFRPLVMGSLQGATLFASEDAPLREMGCERVRDVLPGEVVVVDVNGVQSVRPFMSRPRASQVVDLVHLASDDSQIAGRTVSAVRRELGRRTAVEQPCENGSVVVAYPGAVPVAQGYAEQARLPLRYALDLASTAHLQPLPGVPAAGEIVRARSADIRGKDVILVLPALVAGVPVRDAIAALRRAGARHVHLRVASPPVAHQDPYGLAMPTTEELGWNQLGGAPALTGWLGADSLGYLSLAALRDEVPDWEDGWCDTVFSGDLPVPTHVDRQLPLFESKAADRP